MENQGKGIKVGGNKVIVRKTKQGQYRITIPRIFAESILLQDKDILSFHPSSRDGLLIKKERITLEEIKKLKEEKRIIEQRLG